MAAVEPQKKNRLSRLLGGSKREKSPDSPAPFPPDSAYASSDVATPAPDVATPGPAVSNEQIVPAEKDSEIANIDKDRNLGVKPSTGQVVDRDTGEVVTVVTTTTTTTTTTTRKPGKKSPDVHKDVQETTQTQPAIDANTNADGTVDPMSDKSGIIAEMPATPAEVSQPTYPVSGDASSKIRKQSPPLPTRNSIQKSGELNREYDNANINSSYNPAPDVSPEGSYMARPGPTGNTPPLSPQNPNYSYPTNHAGRDSLDGVGLSTTNQPHRSGTGKSTLADLKAAAKGLHGVGETLRGTLNSAVDENFPRKNAKKQAYATAKNEATLARGRDEVGSLPHRSRHNDPTESYNYYPNPQRPPSRERDSGGNHHTYTSSAAPPPIPQNQPPTGVSHSYGGGPAAPAVRPPSPQRTPTAEQTNPGSWGGADGYDHSGGGTYGGVGNAGGGHGLAATAAANEQENFEQQQQQQQKSKGGIGKLFKRKPVAQQASTVGKEGELRDRKYY